MAENELDFNKLEEAEKLKIQNYNLAIELGKTRLMVLQHDLDEYLKILREKYKQENENGIN